MINYLNKKDLVKSSFVNVFNGFMKLEENLKNIDVDELFRELEMIVYKELKYRNQSDVKPMKNITKVSKDCKPLNDENNSSADNYNQFK